LRLPISILSRLGCLPHHRSEGMQNAHAPKTAHYTANAAYASHTIFATERFPSASGKNYQEFWPRSYGQTAFGHRGEKDFVSS